MHRLLPQARSLTSGIDWAGILSAIGPKLAGQANAEANKGAAGFYSAVQPTS